MINLKTHAIPFSIIAFVLIFLASNCSNEEDSLSATDGNTAPLAYAGTDLNVLTGFPVTLDGDGSSDSDGDALTYQWIFHTKPAGSTATLSGASSVNPSFTPDVDGVYVISLIVNDGSVDSDVVFVTFTAGDTAENTPIADAGTNRNVITDVLVTLDGSGSWDPDGDALSYYWLLHSKPGGSKAALSQATSVNPSFTPDADGVYIISLVVNDGVTDSAFDNVTITAGSIAENPPVADAGTNKNVVTGLIVELDGSGSSDPDGDALTYLWTLVSKPAGSASALTAATSVTPSFTPDVDGVYVINLVVNDRKFESNADSVRITAASTVNNPPVADAGSDQDVTTGTSVTLDGSGSFDPDGDTLSYLWAFQSKPSTSCCDLSSTTTVSPTFNADVDGIYTLRLVVNDGKTDSNIDKVTITATTSCSGNTPPVADAGDDQNVVTGIPAILSGGDSYDVDLGYYSPFLIDYSWTLISKPPGSSASLDTTTTRNTSFTPDVEGDYIFRLVVNDGCVDSAPDTVVVSATHYSLVSDYDFVDYQCNYTTNGDLDITLWIVNRGASDPGATLIIREDDVFMGREDHVNETIYETPDGNNSTAFRYVVSEMFQVSSWEAFITDADSDFDYKVIYCN